jgi:hypothetical protein
MKEIDKKHFEVWTKLLELIVLTLNEKGENLTPEDLYHLSSALQRTTEGRLLAKGIISHEQLSRLTED